RARHGGAGALRAGGHRRGHAFRSPPPRRRPGAADQAPRVADRGAAQPAHPAAGSDRRPQRSARVQPSRRGGPQPADERDEPRQRVRGAHGQSRLAGGRAAGRHPVHRVLDVQGPVAAQRHQHPLRRVRGKEAAPMIKVLLLLAGAALVVFFLANRRKARAKAGVKIGFVLFVVFMVYAVIRPDDLTVVANALGVQRGTDLVLYALVMGFAFVTVSTYVRFREQELRYSRLARTIALQHAVRPDDKVDAVVMKPAPDDDDPMRS